MRSSTTFTEHRGDEVYVFVRGLLVSKVWLLKGLVAVFHVKPAGTAFYSYERVPETPHHTSEGAW